MSSKKASGKPKKSNEYQKPEGVFDTSVLNRLLTDYPQFPKYMTVYVPESLKKSKEGRTNARLLKHIKDGSITVCSLCPADRNEVARMIEEGLGNPEVARRYKNGKMKHDQVEYDCMFISKDKKIPLFIFDKKAEARAKKAIGRGHKVNNIVELVDYLPMTREQKYRFLGNLTKMRYHPAEDKLKELKLIPQSSGVTVGKGKNRKKPAQTTKRKGSRRRRRGKRR